MKLIPKERQIYISARTWHEIDSKIKLAPFIYALHKRIDLSKYGDGLQKFYFTFLILRPENEKLKSGTYFNKDEKAMEISVPIDYDQAEKASPSELIKLMEKSYLDGIDLIKTLPLKSNFDVAAFKHDVEAIFKNSNWFEKAIEA